MIQARERYWNARTNFFHLNNTAGEKLAEIAMRAGTSFSGRRSKSQLRTFGNWPAFMSEHRETLGWIPPRGGMTAFPWLVSGETAALLPGRPRNWASSRPGDCWNAPSIPPWLRRSDRQNFPKALTGLGNSSRAGRHATW